MPKIITLVGWSGDDFAHTPGDEVDVDADTAAARVEAGVAEYVPGQEPKPASKKATKERAGTTVETAAVEPATEKRTSR